MIESNRGIGLEIKRRTIDPTLDLTPLIDVVFLLIIFFMLSSSFILQQGISVDLPSAKVRDSQKEKSVEVTLTKGDKYFYNGQKIELEKLIVELKLLGMSNPNAGVVLKIDGSVPHQKTVDLMSLVRENNLRKLAIATK